MPSIMGTVSVAAATTNDNLLSGSQWEFMPFDGMLEFGLNGDANGADLRVDVFSGPDILLENAPMGTQNRMPIYPDDYPLNDVAAAGERIKIRVRNTNGASPRSIFYVLKITPMM